MTDFWLTDLVEHKDTKYDELVIELIQIEQEVAGQVAMYHFANSDFFPRPINSVDIPKLIEVFNKHCKFFQFQFGKRYYYTDGPADGSETYIVYKY